MTQPEYTAERLLLEDSFLEFMFDPRPATISKWQALVSQHNISDEVIEKAKGMLAMLSPGLPRQEITEEISKLSQSLICRETVTQERAARRSRRRYIIPVSMLAIVASVIWLWMNSSVMIKEPETILARYSSNAGEHKKIQLPDGSSVILNSNSTVSITSEYNLRERRLLLSGQAFFSVAKNPSKPFTVSNNNFTTTAVGTAFYVTADSLNPYSVQLLEGKVRVSAGLASNETVITPGQQAIWQATEKEFSKQAYDTTYFRNWISGLLTFHHTSANAAFALLSKWYGIKIKDERVKGSAETVSGSYENAKLDDVLKVICFSLNCSYRHRDDSIIIE